jgi:hypothetical protein
VDGEVRRITVRTGRPSRDAAGVLRLFKERLAALEEHFGRQAEELARAKEQLSLEEDEPGEPPGGGSSKARLRTKLEKALKDLEGLQKKADAEKLVALSKFDAELRATRDELDESANKLALTERALAEAKERLAQYGIEYIVWLDGLTQRSQQAGTISCTIGPGGGGCFGFGTWQDDSNFEAEVWDLDTLESVGSISTDAVGQSYMPALVVPIPLIARVEANACSGLGNQLKQFIDGKG